MLLLGPSMFDKKKPVLKQFQNLLRQWNGLFTSMRTSFSFTNDKLNVREKCSRDWIRIEDRVTSWPRTSWIGSRLYDVTTLKWNCHLVWFWFPSVVFLKNKFRLKCYSFGCIFAQNFSHFNVITTEPFLYIITISSSWSCWTFGHVRTCSY